MELNLEDNNLKKLPSTQTTLNLQVY